MQSDEAPLECIRCANRLASRIELLEQPYRQNTITWLESCAARSLEDLDRGLVAFFAELDPTMREVTASNLEIVLEDALDHFGHRPPTG